jgi:hypothetical protein
MSDYLPHPVGNGTTRVAQKQQSPTSVAFVLPAGTSPTTAPNPDPMFARFACPAALPATVMGSGARAQPHATTDATVLLASDTSAMFPQVSVAMAAPQCCSGTIQGSVLCTPIMDARPTAALPPFFDASINVSTTSPGTMDLAITAAAPPPTTPVIALASTAAPKIAACKAVSASLLLAASMAVSPMSSEMPASATTAAPTVVTAVPPTISAMALALARTAEPPIFANIAVTSSPAVDLAMTNSTATAPAAPSLAVRMAVSASLPLAAGIAASPMSRSDHAKTDSATTAPTVVTAA